MISHYPLRDHGKTFFELKSLIALQAIYFSLINNVQIIRWSNYWTKNREKYQLCTASSFDLEAPY